MSKFPKKYNEYYLSWNEINEIIGHAKNLKERVILKILARSGMRRFELINLKIKDIDFDRKRLYISTGKGASSKDTKARTVPIDEDTLQEIKFYIGNRRAGNIIQSNKKGFEGISKSQINRIVANAAKRANIQNPNPRLKNMNPHIFRHSFSRLSLAEGVPFNIVQRIVGHADARTTLQMYGIPSITDAQKLYDEKLSSKFKSSSGNEKNQKLNEFDKSNKD